MEGFRNSCRRRPKARDSLRFSHIILTKCHKGLEANKRQQNKRGCCCKAFIEGRRKDDTKQQSTMPPQPTSPSSPDLQRGDEEGQIRGFNGRGSEPFAPGGGGRRALSCRWRRRQRGVKLRPGRFTRRSVLGEAVRLTHPEQCESAQLSQRHFKKTKQKQKNSDSRGRHKHKQG